MFLITTAIVNGTVVVADVSHAVVIVHDAVFVLTVEVVVVAVDVNAAVVVGNNAAIGCCCCCCCS